MAVKEKQPVADNMFEPLKETIELLKTYGQELPDEVHQQLQVYCMHCRTGDESKKNFTVFRNNFLAVWYQRIPRV